MLTVCNSYGKFTGTPDKSKFYITFFLDTIFYILKTKKSDEIFASRFHKKPIRKNKYNSISTS